MRVFQYLLHLIVEHETILVLLFLFVFPVQIHWLYLFSTVSVMLLDLHSDHTSQLLWIFDCLGQLIL